MKPAPQKRVPFLTLPSNVTFSVANTDGTAAGAGPTYKPQITVTVHLQNYYEGDERVHIYGGTIAGFLEQKQVTPMDTWSTTFDLTNYLSGGGSTSFAVKAIYNDWSGDSASQSGTITVAAPGG